MKRNRQRGFSLMEVLLATSILLACVVVLGELAEVGRRHAVGIDDLTTAQMICQTKLNEIVIGAAPLTAVEQASVPEAPDWLYWVELESQTDLDLVAVRVTVAGQPVDSDSSSQRPKKSFTLTRWIHRATPEASTTASDVGLPDMPSTFGFDEGLLP